MIAVDTTQFRRSRPAGRRPAAFVAALVVYIIVILVAAPQAQQPTFAMNSGAPIRDAADTSEIDLLVGRSTVLNVGSTIARVSLTVPDIADALVTAPSQLLIHGKQPGTISLFVWDKAGAIKTFEVKVRRDLNALKEHLKQLFPGEAITVLGSGKDVVISGTVSGQYVIDKAADVAAGYVEKKENVVNLLKQQEGVASNQVMLRVRFAEVSRSALTELGASFAANARNDKWFGRATTQQFAAPEWDEQGRFVFSDFLNLFIFNSEEGLAGVVRLLQNKGLFQSLAEPNLIATNGKEASFLAGGEYPYPVIQPSSGGNAVTIVFKEFGIRLHFTPTVLGGDLIHLKVRPEVSALDFSNAIVLEGFRVPALSTRRTETEVELRDGQTFAIAGLMNNTLTNSMSKIPGIGDIPILGLLFRSKAHQKNQTELVVMITPTIIRRGQMGVSEGLPSLVEPYLGAPDKRLPNPDAYVGSPRYPVNQPQRSGGGQPAPDAMARPVAPQAAPLPSRPLPQAPAAPEAPAPARPMTAEPMTGMPGPVSTAPVTAAPMSPAPMSAAPMSSSPAPMPAMPAPMPAGPMPASPAPMAPGGMPMAPGGMPMAPGGMPMAPAPSGAMEPEGPAAVMPPGMPMPSATPSPAPTKAEMKALEEARRQEQRAAEAEARQHAASQKKAEEDRRQAERLAKERAKREAEIARKNAEMDKKRAEEDKKREKSLSEAATRLKEAQSAYQSELEKAKGGTNEKRSSGGGR
ncbi:MAG TPA: pilus assembly protein N-terminal domain-containing protein [Vicinamibacterales bacterium]|nr:pilus assembly protein N-terminal domain-containing protein [Vicinamibacterales bacterium]